MLDEGSTRSAKTVPGQANAQTQEQGPAQGPLQAHEPEQTQAPEQEPIAKIERAQEDDRQGPHYHQQQQQQQQHEERQQGPRNKLVMERVSYTVNKGQTTILDRVSVSVASGELVAVMGASGSGKTTLEMLMTGVTPQASGTIFLNGVVVSQAELRRAVVYVPQDDLLLHTMTTEEALLESAKFNNTTNASLETLKARVETLLKKFNLHTCRHVRVGSPETKKGLSGGQRKRLSIALEMIASKAFLVLDEPTSGLDSSSADAVVALLRATASNEGTGVLATIHSPSAELFFSFDKILLLVQGRMAYFGPTKEMMSFFNTIGFHCPEYTNPADWAIKLLTVNEESGTVEDQERIDKIVAGASNIEVRTSSIIPHVQRASPAKIEDDPSVLPSEIDLENGPQHEIDRSGVHSAISNYEPLATVPMLPLGSQIAILLRRNIRHMKREPALGRARMGSHTLLGVVIGILFYNLAPSASSIPDRIALNLFCMVFLMLSCALPTVITFLPERAVFIKEQRNRRYSSAAFYLAKAFADLPLQIIPAAIFFTIVFFMSGYGEGDGDGGSLGIRYASMLLALLVFVLTVHAWATFISCVAPSLSVAIFMVPMSFMPMLLLMGFFKPVDDISWILRWASYFPNFFSPVWRMINIAGFINFQFSGGSTSGTGFTNGNQVLQSRLGIDSSWNAYWQAFGVLLAYLVCVRVAAFVALVKLHTKGSK